MCCLERGHNTKNWESTLGSIFGMVGPKPFHGSRLLGAPNGAQHFSFRSVVWGPWARIDDADRTVAWPPAGGLRTWRVPEGGQAAQAAGLPPPALGPFRGLGGPTNTAKFIRIMLLKAPAWTRPAAPAKGSRRAGGGSGRPPRCFPKTTGRYTDMGMMSIPCLVFFI
jgi:hypothetical protein